MKDAMQRGRSQVIWKYSPGATFRYNESGGWAEVTDVTIRDPEALPSAVASALKHELLRWDAIGPMAFPDPVEHPSKFVIGEPLSVSYTLWPTVFTCRKCERVHYYRDVAGLSSYNDRLRCQTCKSENMLRQVPYAFVCECGRKDSLFAPKHEHDIYLVDKGNFQESYWFCRQCRIPLQKNPREGLGFRPCKCGKTMRGVVLQDTRVYYSQSVELVDIEPQVLARWRSNPRFRDLLAAAVIYSNAYKPSHIRDLAAFRSETGGEADAMSPELRVMSDVLAKQGRSEAEIAEVIRQIRDTTVDDPWSAYDASLADVGIDTNALDLTASRRSIEYVFVRDEPTMATISLATIRDDASQRGDSATAGRLTSEIELAAELGLLDLAIVEALPIVLAGYGFTRYFASPGAAAESGESDGKKNTLALRPFPTAAHRDKLPIFAARNTTEALSYRLDPWRVAAALVANNVATLPPNAFLSETQVRVWLLSLAQPLLLAGESHLVLTSFETDAGLRVDEASALLFGILHTISHVLKATAHRYVGIDADSLAEYLFAAHASGLIYVSSHVQFTLGGIDSVVRANLRQWLTSARDYAGQCSFDPVCSHAGGACLACLYPKFGCAYFNRTVSRSFLFGGHVQGRDQRVIGFWEPEVTAVADSIRDSRVASPV